MVTYASFVPLCAAPLVSISPPVATILPGQESIRLRCQTNSNDLPILWVAENLVTELSNSPDYSVPIPAQGRFADFTAFTCIVRDPEVSDTSANNIVGRAVAYVRNILGECEIEYAILWSHSLTNAWQQNHPVALRVGKITTVRKLT